MARGARYYQPIQGSARLATAPLAASTQLRRAEALAAGDMRRVPFEGDLIGAAQVRGRCAAIPLEVFDAVGARLEPEEQGAYFQLLRLSYAEGRNFCRAPKRDLVARLGTTERRFHRIVDGLVRKGFLRLLHRDNRGTAYRVFLPREAAGKPGDDVLLGVVRAEAPPRPRAPHATASARTAAPREDAAASPPAAIPLGDARTRALAVALAGARGAPEGEGVPAALREIAELVGDGATPRQIEAAIRAVSRRRASRGDPP